MPSARTTNPPAVLARTESSLWERTMPESERVTISRTCRKSIATSDGNIQIGADDDARSAGRAAHHAQAGANVGGHLRAGLVAMVGILHQGLIEDAPQAVGQIRLDGADVRVRFIGDLEHQLGHGFALEGQAAAGELEQRDTEREKVGTAVDLLA